MAAYVIPLIICFILWSTYAIPGTMAEKTHGVSVNMLFETLAFIGVSILLSGKIYADLPKVTLVSGLQASLMGAGSALGFYFFLKALSMAPGATGFALILLVAGVTFPIQGALNSLKWFGNEPLSMQQWFAIVCMMFSIGLYNWKF